MTNGIQDIKRKYSNREIWLWPAQTKKNSEYLTKMNRNREAIENLIEDLEFISKFFLVIPIINELNSLPGRPKASILCKITRYKALNLFKIKIFVNDLKEEEKTTLEELNDSPKDLLEYLLNWQKGEIEKMMNKIKCPWLLDNGECSLHLPGLKDNKCPWFSSGIITVEEIGTAEEVASQCRKAIWEATLSEIDKKTLINEIGEKLTELKQNAI